MANGEPTFAQIPQPGFSPPLGNLAQQPSWQQPPSTPQQKTSLGQTFTGPHTGLGDMAQQWQGAQPSTFSPGMNLGQFIQASGGMDKNIADATQYGMGFSPGILKMARTGLPWQDVQNWLLMDEAGKNVGSFESEFIHPDRLHVHWQGADQGPWALGTANVRSLLPEIRREYPEAKYITASRISGARTGPAAAPSPDKSAYVNIPIPQHIQPAEPNQWSGFYLEEPAYRQGALTPGQWREIPPQPPPRQPLPSGPIGDVESFNRIWQQASPRAAANRLEPGAGPSEELRNRVLQMGQARERNADVYANAPPERTTPPPLERPPQRSITQLVRQVQRGAQRRTPGSSPFSNLLRGLGISEDSTRFIERLRRRQGLPQEEESGPTRDEIEGGPEE